jgi:hypothetical protein
MFTWFSRSARIQPKRFGRFRPAVEQLEGRELMSATTSAVSWGPPQAPYSAMFAIDSSTHHVVEYWDTNNQANRSDLSFWGGPAQASAVSAGLDGQGNPEVYVLGSDHSVWSCHSGAWFPAWSQLASPGWATQISGTRDGYVFAVGPGGNVFENAGSGNANTWQSLGAPSWTIYWGGMQFTFSGATQVSAPNRFMVYAISDNHAIYAYDNGWQLIDSGHYFTEIAAGAHATVFAIDYGGALYSVALSRWGPQWREFNIGNPESGSRFVDLSVGQNFGGFDQLYTVNSWGDAYRLDNYGWQFVDAGVHEIAAADNNTFFDVGFGSPYEYDPLNNWPNHFVPLGGSVL